MSIFSVFAHGVRDLLNERGYTAVGGDDIIHGEYCFVEVDAVKDGIVTPHKILFYDDIVMVRWRDLTTSGSRICMIDVEYASPSFLEEIVSAVGLPVAKI